MWFILIAVLLLLLLFNKSQAEAQDTRKASVNVNTAKAVIAQWRDIVQPYCTKYSVPLSKALSHICVESIGKPYALRCDGLGESYFAKNPDDAFLKLSEWERKGFPAIACSIGPMQVVPKYGLADFNNFFYRKVQSAELVTDLDLSCEVGVGFLLILRNRWKDWTLASRAYNGNPNSDVTLDYIQKITAYEGLINQLLFEG